jgi:DNA-binding GntR family transcriptional regulator
MGPGEVSPLSRLQQELADRRSTSLSTLIVDRLDEMIIKGDLPAGARLNESQLADSLGVSRGPVREACRQLERSGLLEFRSNRGMFVRELSAEEAIHLYDVRSGLFGLAGRLAVPRATPADVEDLRNTVDAIGGASDVDHYYPGNVEFHQKLVALSGNPRLIQLHGDLSKELHLLRRNGLESAEARKQSTREHREIVDSFAAGDPARTADLMERHVLEGKKRVLDGLRC